jgi:hypothetical protein
MQQIILGSGVASLCREHQRIDPHTLERGIPFVAIVGVKDQIRIRLTGQPAIL